MYRLSLFFCNVTIGMDGCKERWPMRQMTTALQQQESADNPLAPDPAWLEDAVFYQIFPERFFNGDPTNDPYPLTPWGKNPQLFNFYGGDLAGIMQKIPYLQELGVNSVYLNPIFDAPSNHKYDTRDYLRISPEFGDFRTYLELLDKLHKSGLRMILDGVFNHTGDQFWAFRDLLARGKKSPYHNWYFCHQYPVCQVPKPNYECWWGIETLPKLNYAESALVRYILRVVAFWTMTGIDGWRLDVPNEIIREFWPVFRRLVKKINPEAYIVGEIWDDATAWLQGDMFDSVMNYPLRNLMVSFFVRGELDAAGFDHALSNLRAQHSPKVTMSMFNLLGSHDTPRFLTLCKGKKERMLLALLFLMTYPGVPVIYYGDEIGMTGEKDPDCRKTMVWNEKLWDQEIFNAAKNLIGLRKSKDALKKGEFRTALAGNNGVFGYWRLYNYSKLLVLMNRTNKLQHVQAPLPVELRGAWQKIYPLTGQVRQYGEFINLHLPPWYGAIWEQKL